MKPIRFGKRFQKWVMSLLLPAFAMTGSPVQANPRGGVVVHGAADIAKMAGNQLRINQHSNAVIINWQDFSIGKGEVTRFVQPNNGTALNRVVTGNVSQIHGQLKGNANVYVINPNGIVIGGSGVIDVGGNAVLSTLDIDDNDFLDGGASRFSGSSDTGVTNFGTINSTGGDVVDTGVVLPRRCRQVRHECHHRNSVLDQTVDRVRNLRRIDGGIVVVVARD
jgi:filamentous hemagglutinin family protein